MNEIIVNSNNHNGL